MNSEFMTSIFDMFVQSDDTLDRSEGGMGVGLTLVRALVDMHQGEIEARSDGSSRGSEFVVRIPVTAAPSRNIKSSDPAPPAEVPKRLVLVEDDDDAREMMALLLRRQGDDLLASADNGLDGLQAIQELRPDVAIVDIGLPKLDGYQLARRVRAALGNTVHLIALTGYGRQDDRESVVESGFDRHLVKPINIQELTKAMCEVMS